MKNPQTLLKISACCCLLFASAVVWSQDLQVVQLYTAKGKSVKMEKMAKKLEKAELVLFGEEHNSLVGHYLSEKVFDLFAQDGGNEVLAMEMFERDQQETLDSLMANKIDLEKWETYTRVWPNIADYLPLMQMALDAKARIVASNIPRKYASALFHGGRDSLKVALQGHENEACSTDFPVDRSLSQYAALADGELHMGGKNLVEAQAIKDATMGMSVADQLKNGQRVFHLNGCYHSDFHQGVLWYVEQDLGDVNVITISIVSADILDWNKDYEGKADYIFVVKDDFPKTYN